MGESDGTIVRDIDVAAVSCTDDLEKITKDDEEICTEMWLLADDKVRCVSGFVSFKRKLQPPNYATIQNQCDVRLDYRKYEVTAKWAINGGLSDPLSTSFN